MLSDARSFAALHVQGRLILVKVELVAPSPAHPRFSVVGCYVRLASDITRPIMPVARLCEVVA